MTLAQSLVSCISVRFSCQMDYLKILQSLGLLPWCQSTRGAIEPARPEEHAKDTSACPDSQQGRGCGRRAGAKTSHASRHCVIVPPSSRFKTWRKEDVKT